MFTNTKDMTSLLPKSSVVYRFKCTGCHMEYVGEADRNLEERINEHATKSNQPSAVYNHIYSCDHFQYLYKIMSFSKLFHGNIWNKDLSFYRGGSSEARWWNPECVNTYKVSTLVCHRLHTKLY